MPAPFVLVAPRRMAGATDTTATPVTPELPVLNITVKVDSLIRLPGDPVVATVVVNRTVNSDVSCSVPWSILGTGTNPVTSAYFIGSVFPSGTISFGIGETSKTVTFSLSAGSRPSFEMTGRFRLGVPTGAKLGATSFFDFYLLSPLTFPTRVDAAEPGWVNIPTYATSPGKVLFSTVADMTTAISSASAGSTVVLTTNLDAGGATFTLDAEGTTADPIFLRGNSDKKASFPELSNATIICTGQRWVICNLRLKNVRILVRSSSYTEIKQNRFYFYSDGGATKGAIVFESTSTSRYTHIYGNDFIGSNDTPFKRSAIFGGALTGGVFYKYVWVRKNLFKGFTDDPTVANSAIMIGPNDHDSLTDAHFYVAENLFLDYTGVGYVVDTGLAGVACFDNTFEAKTSTSKQWLRIRQGCTKPDQSTGNIVDGNLWVASPSGGGGNWWDFPARSGRLNGRRSGISYWGASGSTFTANLALFENNVAPCDAWNGGNPDAADATMDMVTGGPNTTDNDTITSGSNLDWSGSSSHWRAGWNNLPSGTIAIWAANFISRDRRTDGGDGSIWTDIIAGNFDRHYTNMGRRIKKNFDTPSLNPRGHLPSRLLIRMNHENNQSNYYRVLAAQKTNYVNAMNRAIDKIRVGLGPYANDVKFMHAPAHGSEGIDLGSYASWCPSNVDVLSVSWHPRAAQNSALKLTEYNNGEDDPLSYGLSELLAYSISTGKPMCFPEWSPRYEAGTGVACPVADLAMDSFDAFLTANAARIICDCVYHQRTLDVNGYEPTDTAGRAAWARAVSIFKTKWSTTVGTPYESINLGGISVADGYTVVANNWACLLATGAQPTLTSPSGTAKIALARGSLDWTNYPTNVPTAPAGRAWPNAAYAFVGGNHIPIVVGDATTRPWVGSDALVKAANLYIAPNDVARADRNISITYGPSHSVTDIVTTTVVSQGSYNRIPTRYTETSTGLGLISGLSYPIDAVNYSLATSLNTAKTQNLISGYTGPTPLVATIESAPSHGSASIASGVVTYTPTSGYTGADSFTYRLTDAEGTYVIGTVTMAIGGVSLTISAPANVNEGDSGTQTIRFTVTKSGTTASSCSATWTLTGGVNAADFQSGQAFSGTVTFASGDTTKNIDFTLKGDTNPEDNEQMTVTLSAPSSCSLGTPYFGTTSILNDDTAALGGRLYNPPHGPASTSDVVTWLVTDTYPGDGNWTKYLLIVLPPSATQLRIQQQTLKYKGVFIIGGKMNVTGNQSHPFQGKTESLSGHPGNVIHLNFTTTDMPSGLIGNGNGNPADGRPFIWIDGVDMDTCWNTGDVMGTQMSSWWGDFFSFGTKTPSGTNQGKNCDVYLLRHRIKNGTYFGNLQPDTQRPKRWDPADAHSDIMQNNNAMIRSLSMWKCDHKHFGQGIFYGSGSYTLPNDGWVEVSDCVFRRPPKTSKIYKDTQTPTWNPIQAVDNSCNPDTIVHMTRQFGASEDIAVQPGEYFALLLGPRNYFEFPAAVDTTIDCQGIGLMGYNSVYGTTRKVDRNYSSRVMTVGVSDICVTHDPPFHKYPYVGKTGAGGPFNRAAGFYTRSCGMSVPSTAPLTEAEVGLSRRITTAADLLTYISSGT